MQHMFSKNSRSETWAQNKELAPITTGVASKPQADSFVLLEK